MKRKWLIAALAVLIAGPGWLAAQRPRRPPAPARPFGVFSFSGNRGRIGVVVNTAADSATDKLGARIEAVTPSGPAAKAGLKAGDIITKFNGTSLAGVPAEASDQSGPGMKLIELAHQLDPGDTVAVEYRRGGDTKKASLVAEDLGVRMEMGGLQLRQLEGQLDSMNRVLSRGFSISFGEPWGDLDLVTLNPDLGEYFGTREGILVVKAPADSELPLKGGDVILSIGGRKPTSPSHATRILRSYEEGETVTLDIVRKQKRMTVTWKVPAREGRYFQRWRDRDDDHREPS